MYIILSTEYFMIQQIELSKFISFTGFGFNISDGWNDAALRKQTDQLKSAIDLLQTQWPLIHVAFVHEHGDYGPIDNREDFFGLIII